MAMGVAATDVIPPHLVHSNDASANTSNWWSQSSWFAQGPAPCPNERPLTELPTAVNDLATKRKVIIETERFDVYAYTGSRHDLHGLCILASGVTMHMETCC